MKRGKIDELMDAIGAIDEELIAEAAKVRAGSAAEAGSDAEAGSAGGTQNALPAKKRRLRLAALAACLCLAVLTGVYFGSRAGTSDEELPLLDIAPVATVGMGDSAIGLAGTDLDEFDNGNPWREEMGLKTLPAFKNSRYDSAGAPIGGLSAAEMKERLQQLSAAFAVELLDIQERKLADGTLFGLSAQSGEIALEAERNGGMYIYFRVRAESEETAGGRTEGGLLALPAQWAGDGAEMTDEEARELILWLTDKYAAAFGFDDPQPVTYVESNLVGDCTRRFAVYDKGSSDVADIINYNLARVEFYIGDGFLQGVCINGRLDVIEEAGSYPLISVAEATEKLLAGEYKSLSGNYDIEEEQVEKVELVYSTGTEAYLIPYYQFYVNDPYEGMREDVVHYKICLVPAVADEYILTETLASWRCWG